MHTVTSDITTLQSWNLQTAGRSTFQQVIQILFPNRHLPQKSFVWNATFAENEGSQDMKLPANRKCSADKQRCLPEELRSVFTAAVTLEGGNTIHSGQRLKGTVIVQATNGSTTMSHISATFVTTRDHHWATEQAINPENAVPDSSPYVFEEGDDNSVRFSDPYPRVHRRIALDDPHFDFELQVPQTAVPDFSAYYSSGEATLDLELTVLYSRDAAICIHGMDKYVGDDLEDGSLVADDAAKIEGLWDSYTSEQDEGSLLGGSSNQSRNYASLLWQKKIVAIE
ncbi:hypothetical protein DFH07DRAFT_1015323 [Mycena maculata]|uniref:Uncharacterized protein n=1 Tax=Mycena maculata TaxID=230809 RepID=A0AAD7JL09_9AGAR|nr:hypothetical protein DFH07DRAFT_1015323 [Mycena maculata]